MEKYEILNIIGEGTYGKVVKALNKESGQFVAIKKFKYTEDNHQVKKTALREIRTLKMLKHPNIVTLLEVLTIDRKFYLIFEFIDHTILELIQKSSFLDLQTAKNYTYQLLRALTHCHSLGVIHRDIKPENLLVSSSGILKICDFGFARSITQQSRLTEYVSTRWYRAPELLVGGRNYSFPSDIWACGCVFYEMLTGQPLFPGISDSDTLFREIKTCGNLTEEQKNEFFSHSKHLGIELPKFSLKLSESKFKKIPMVFAEFIKMCLNIRPDLRPTGSELVCHFIFEDRFKEEIEKELGGGMSPKVRRKGFVNPNHTPEPQSYLRIYEKKKSPPNWMRSKNSEERLRNKNYSPIQVNLEKSFLLPEISRNEKFHIRKDSPKYTKKHIEHKSESKAAIKAHRLEATNTISRNPSLSYEKSVDALLKPLQKSDLSTRNKNLSRKEIFNASSRFQASILLPHQYRLKRKNS